MFTRPTTGRLRLTGNQFSKLVFQRGAIALNPFALKNFGQPMQYGGEGLGILATAQNGDRPVEYYKVDAASFDLPFTFDMGLTYDIAGANLGLTFTSNYYATDEIKAGASYDIGNLASVGVGFQTSTVAKEQGPLGKGLAAVDAVNSDWYVNPFDGLSFGGSLNLQSLIGMNMSVDFAMMPAGDFGTNQVLAMRMGF